jgi:hypothetical protein
MVTAANNKKTVIKMGSKDTAAKIEPDPLKSIKYFLCLFPSNGRKVRREAQKHANNVTAIDTGQTITTQQTQPQDESFAQLEDQFPENLAHLKEHIMKVIRVQAVIRRFVACGRARAEREKAIEAAKMFWLEKIRLLEEERLRKAKTVEARQQVAIYINIVCLREMINWYFVSDWG